MVQDRTLEDLQARYEEFKQKREWGQFHTPQNVAQALSVEAGELLELFLWHDNLPSGQIREHEGLRDEVRDELADIVIYALSMASELNIDLLQAVEEKMDENESRFDQESAAEMTAELQEWQRK